MNQRLTKALTTGVLKYLASRAATYLALSDRPGALTNALTALQYTTVYHPIHVPDPRDNSVLYLWAMGGPDVEYTKGAPISATVDYYITKGTTYISPSGVAPAVADAEMMGDVAQAIADDIMRLSDRGVGVSKIKTPAGVDDDIPLAKVILDVQSVAISYYPSLELEEGREIHALSYRIRANYRLVRF